MIEQSEIKAEGPGARPPNMTTQESERQQQRKDTRKWISENALSALRLAWRS